MTVQKFTTTACRNLLPRVLIDYLWQLSIEGGAGLHIFILNAKYTGAGEVQDILHRYDSFSSWRRVFGYQPVEAVVTVDINDAGAVMSLAEGSPESARAGWKEELPCSA